MLRTHPRQGSTVGGAVTVPPLPHLLLRLQSSQSPSSSSPFLPSAHPEKLLLGGVEVVGLLRLLRLLLLHPLQAERAFPAARSLAPVGLAPPATRPPAPALSALGTA